MAKSVSASTGLASLTGLFTSRESAEEAYRATTSLGYDGSDISVLMSDETRERLFSSAGPQRTELARRAAKPPEETRKPADHIGGPVGGTVGTIAPAVTALGALLLVPGLDIVTAGPIAIALTAAGAVGVAGGLVGALTNWGIPRPHVEHFEEQVMTGGILLGVKPRSEDDAKKLSQRWQAAGGELVQS